jgi:hypothetical protein
MKNVDIYLFFFCFFVFLDSADMDTVAEVLEFVKRALRCDDLENLHMHASEETRFFHESVKTFGKDDRQSPLLKMFHDAVDADGSNFRLIYRKLAKEILVTQGVFASDSVLIQKTPNLRVSWPGASSIGALSSDTGPEIGRHTDSQFGHHPASVNMIFAITPMLGSNSIIYEQDDAKEASITLDAGAWTIKKFCRIPHWNTLNTTGRCRLSFDFRATPVGCETANGAHNLQNNYYENLDLT